MSERTRPKRKPRYLRLKVRALRGRATDLLNLA